MKFKVNRTAILKLMTHAQNVVERRNTIPILSHVLLSAEADLLTIKATDLDIEVVLQTDVEVLIPGKITVAAHMLHDILRKLPENAEVTFSLDTDSPQCDVSAGRSRFSLAILPHEDFPMLQNNEFECHFTIPAAELAKLFNKTKFAVSTEETRYYLNGIYLHVAQKDGMPILRAVATDGHRLARCDCALPDGAAQMHGVIVPRKTLAEVLKMLDGGQSINVAVSETKIQFTNPSMVLTSKVIDGTFPDYARVIPSSNTRKLELDPKVFAAAVDRVSTISTDRMRAVKMTLSKDRLEVSVISPDMGSATDDMAVSYSSDPLEIGFNARYILDICAHLEQDSTVLMFGDMNAPCLIYDGTDTSALYVVMPMRV